MVDIVDSQTRSRMMSGIKGKNTKPEMIVRRFLHSQGFRYRLHDHSLPGHPDIVLPKYRIVIFAHGCFWHRHQGCSYATNPAQNEDKWQTKFSKNVERDKKNIALLLNLGWRVLVIWECTLRPSNPELFWLPEHIKAGGNEYMEWPKQKK